MKLQGFQDNRVAPYSNDCTVRALASVTEIDYFTVFECLRLYGRRPDSGFDIQGFFLDHDCCVLRHKFVWRRLRLDGVFLCWNKGHVWAIRDGILLDSRSGSLRATMIFEVLPNGPDGTEAKLLVAEQRAKAMYSD